MTEQQKETLQKVYLPKWPQCYIYGETVTKEQALEIIRRTDNFFYGAYGNNREFIEEAKKIVKNFEDLYPSWVNEEEFHEDKFVKDWGLLRLEYLVNEWVSCCWIGGTHGWCHPDGTIWFEDNIGKWPHAEEIFIELEEIAKAFPFLKMRVTLMDGESPSFEGQHYPNPVITFEVKDGTVNIVDTDTYERIWMDCPKIGRPRGWTRENFFEIDQIKAWAKQVYGDK